MTCPVCGGQTTVEGSRPDCEAVYRRRRCNDCNHIFHTTEEESDGEDYIRLTRAAREKSRRKRKEARGCITENSLNAILRMGRVSE